MKYSVLIIDDEKELAESTSEYFNMMGISSKYVLTSQEALDFFKDNEARYQSRRCIRLHSLQDIKRDHKLSDPFHKCKII